MTVTAAVATTRQKTSAAAGPDRLAVAMAALAAFLAILALLAWQLRTSPTARAQQMIVLRRVYETRVIDAITGAAKGSTSSTQTSSGSAAASSPPPPPVARSS